MRQYMKSIPHNMIHVCIDSFIDYQIQGRAYNTTLEEPIIFKDITEFVLQLDSIFDRNGNPYAAQSKRTFQKEEEEMRRYTNKPIVLKEYEQFLSYVGAVGTVDLVVKTRGVLNWQGFLFYENQQEPFEDVLQLFKLILKKLQLS